MSILVYLNPDWREGDGGEIQLTSFLRKPVDVAPLMNRVVFFSSEAILHRVNPATAPRYCFTIWIDGSDVNTDEVLLLKSKHLSLTPDSINFLCKSPLQRILSRSVYDEEYAESLRQCMGSTPGATEMLESHTKRVASLMSNAAVNEFVCGLRALKGKGPPENTTPESNSAVTHEEVELSEESKIDQFACDICGVKGDDDSIKKCARCFGVRYCGRDCQRIGWRNGHKAVCSAPI